MLSQRADTIRRSGLGSTRIAGKPDVLNLEVFPFGLAEIGIVGFGAFGVLDLLGRLISWTNPKGPMPRFRDRVK